jgi:ribosomal protein S27E
VAGQAPFLNPEILEDLPSEAADQGSSLGFLPMECPDCGNELTFRADAALHFCPTCHRLCEVAGGRKQIRPYDHVPMPAGAEADLVPFWRFPMSLRTADGQVLTDLLHLKDGIDGTLDQIGDDAPIREDVLYIPAIRCINARLMARAFNRLFLHALTTRLHPREGPIPLDLKPRPLDISVVEDEARQMAPLCLANAFGQRDLARVNVHQVAAWLLEARLEARGRLTYVPVPLQVTNPFRAYIGRFRGQALDQAAGTV